MLNSKHPDDELLSALAFRDTDATADASLTTHVSSCDRCTDLVNELGALRASLAELPDLQPHRPLRLLPEVAESPVGVDRFGGWARRFFAPLATAGAALAMVGLVGTAAPALNGMASSAGGQADSAESTVATGEAAAEAPEEAGGEAAPEPSIALGAAAPSERSTAASTEEGGDPVGDGFTDASAGAADASSDDSGGDREALMQLPAERSPWPMVLFTGVAVMVAAALLRWILVPRAG